MRRFALAVVAVLFVLVFFGCENRCGAPSASASGGVAATVGGAPITMEELDRAAQKQLRRMETETYQIKRRVLDDLIEEKLVGKAAEKTGQDAEKYLAEEVDSKVTAPTEEEIKAIYDSGKERIGKSFDEVKGQITEYLTQNKKMRVKADLIAKLKEGADIKVNLEPPRVEIDTQDAPAIGDKGAKLTIVEFSDYQCPFCKRVRPTVWRLVDEYKGKLRYVFMDFPLAFHRDARKAHEAARCAADQEKYFEYNRKVFDNQAKIGVEDLKKYAKELQLNTKKFNECLDNGKHGKSVEESIRIGSDAGVSGTPAFFINGILVSGAQPYESLKELVEQELKR